MMVHDPKNDFDSGAGYGLQGIRERVELLRGQIKIDSVPDCGTTLLITIPKNPVIFTTGA